jgi:predicted phosphodiesterase
MQIAVISDLHLGAGGAADAFGHDDWEFLRFLSFLEGNFERIVLLGDIWETLTPHWPLAPREALRNAREAHPEIARRFERPQYTYVHGNHDLIAGVTDGAPEELVLLDRGTRILFTHGHRHDALIRHARLVSEVGVWLGGWLLRLGLRSVHRLFEMLDHVRSGVDVGPTRCTFQRWAVSLASHRQADVVVTGHTHIPLRAEHASALFLNSGSCAQGRFSFLSLDAAAGRYAVHSTW